MESSRNIPRDCLHMRTTEIYLNLGDVTAAKKLTTLKSVPLMLERIAFGCISRFWVYRFWALGRPILYVCIFIQGNQFYGEREVKKKYLYFVKPIRFWASLITQRITFKDESKFNYMLGHLGGSPFNLRSIHICCLFILL